jgi:hypothetical protein
MLAAAWSGFGLSGAEPAPPETVRPPLKPLDDQDLRLTPLPLPPRADTQPAVAPATPAPATMSRPPAAVMPVRPVQYPSTSGDELPKRPPKAHPVVLEDYLPPDPVSPSALRIFQQVAETKRLLLQLAADAQQNAVETTRMKVACAAIAQIATELAGKYGADEEFKSRCAAAKRTVVMLEEQLLDKPVRLAQVQWILQDLLRLVQEFRRAAAEKATALPPPVAVRDAEGRVVYVDPPAPGAKPEEVRQAELEAARAAAEKAAEIRKSIRQSKNFPE